MKASLRRRNRLPLAAAAIALLLSTASASAQEEGGDTPTDDEQRTLLDTLQDGGVVGLMIFGLSMVAVGFIVEHSLTIRKNVLMPEPLLVELEELVAHKNIDGALEACERDGSSLAAEVVRAGLVRYRSSEYGFAEYKAAVEEAGEDQTGRLYRKTEVLGVIGSIAPMLGLTGTVLGMIEAFNTISSSGGMARPGRVGGRHWQGPGDDLDGPDRGDSRDGGIQLFSQPNRFGRGRDGQARGADTDPARTPRLNR